MSKGRREMFQIAVDVLDVLAENELLQSDIMKKCVINNYQCRKITSILSSINWIEKSHNSEKDLRIKFKYKITKLGYQQFEILKIIIQQFRNASKKPGLSLAG